MGADTSTVTLLAQHPLPAPFVGGFLLGFVRVVCMWFLLNCYISCRLPVEVHRQPCHLLMLRTMRGPPTLVYYGLSTVRVFSNFVLPWRLLLEVSLYCKRHHWLTVVLLLLRYSDVTLLSLYECCQICDAESAVDSCCGDNMQTLSRGLQHTDYSFARATRVTFYKQWFLGF